LAAKREVGWQFFTGLIFKSITLSTDTATRFHDNVS
jgi:hypothetical protein